MVNRPKHNGDNWSVAGLMGAQGSNQLICRTFKYLQWPISGKCISVDIHLLYSSCHYHALVYQQKKYLYNNLRLPHEIPSETLSHLKLESNNQSRSTKVEKKIEKERIIKAKKNEANQDEPKQKTIQPESTLGDVGMLKTNQNNHDLAMEPCHWGPRPNPNP